VSIPSPHPNRVMVRGAGKNVGGDAVMAALEETTCVVLGPGVTATLLPGNADDETVEFTVDEVVDKLLRDRCRLAGCRLLQLTDMQARTWVRGREHAMQARFGKRRGVGASVTVDRVDALTEKMAQGPCLVLAVVRNNAVAHLYREFDSCDRDGVRFVVLCRVVSCRVVLCCVVLCCVVLCCVVLCCAVLCCAVLCCVVLCCVSSNRCCGLCWPC